MRKKILVLYILLLGVAMTAFADAKKGFDSDVHVEVKGMVCDFCARGLEKVFKKRKEVNKIAVSLKEGTVDIFMEKDKNLEDETIRKLITSNGISVEKIHRK